MAAEGRSFLDFRGPTSSGVVYYLAVILEMGKCPTAKCVQSLGQEEMWGHIKKIMDSTRAISKGQGYNFIENIADANLDAMVSIATDRGQSNL